MLTTRAVPPPHCCHQLPRPERLLLYKRIEEYISEFYRKYEQERKGLGFVMTVYRRRLTSSFYAVRRSLERRLAFLHGEDLLRPGLAGFDDDDVEEAELALDLGEDPDIDDRSRFRSEIEYVEDFLHDLQALGQVDSKVERLKTDLGQVLKQRETVLVFTQYTDTMDFLREELREVYGAQVACYSGRGGERWDGVAWVSITKEEIKNDFRQGEDVKILLCTEAASEGLNLQTCGVLINYDMPWNPMRVEQRIGRVDRIGQQYSEVWVYNYFYEKTVEAQVYRALEDRIDWFQTVVGELQPILARVGQVIRDVAMTPEEDRSQVLESELRGVEQQLDRVETGFDIDELAEQAEGTRDAVSPVTLADLGEVLVALPNLRDRFSPHEDIERAWWLDTGDRRIAVTFDAQCFDDHPNSIQLLTYGNPTLDAVLSLVPKPDRADAGPLVRLSTHNPLPRVAYYVVANKGRPRQTSSLTDLRFFVEEVGDAGESWGEGTLAELRAGFAAAVRAEAEAIAERRETLHLARAQAVNGQARELLLQAALVEIALGQRPALGEEGGYPAAFHNNAVVGLGRLGYPFGPLLKLVGAAGIEPRPADPFFGAIKNEPNERLRARFGTLRARAASLVTQLAALRHHDRARLAEPYVTETFLDASLPGSEGATDG